MSQGICREKEGEKDVKLELGKGEKKGGKGGAERVPVWPLLNLQVHTLEVL